MKLAFLHPDSTFNQKIFEQLKPALGAHELLAWPSGEAAPAADLDGVLLIGSMTGEQMSTQFRLGFIQTVSAGYEGVELEAATGQGIWVSFSPSGETGNAVSVAEFTVMLMIGASRNLVTAIQSVRGQGINSTRTDAALHGKTVCILGLGGIGRLLAARLVPFGMTIVATDDHPEDVPPGVKVLPHGKMREAWAEADYVVLSMRADKDNENLIDAAALASMKRGATLINIARGTLVDEDALLDALNSGQIMAAGLDVMKQDPPAPGSPLLKLPQVLVTPHIAGLTDIMLAGTAKYVAQVLEEFGSGRKPKSVVNDPPKPRLALR